jgi:hypothetical protein
MHAGNRHGTFTGRAIVNGHHAAAVNTPGNIILVFAGRHTGIAFIAAFHITEKFHSGHDSVSC